jgi:hypothetical protein
MSMLNKYCISEIVTLVEQYAETRIEKLFDILFTNKELHINETIGHIALKSKLISFDCNLRLKSFAKFSTCTYNNMKELLNNDGYTNFLVLSKLRIINELCRLIDSIQIDIFYMNIKLLETIKCKLLKNIFPHDVITSMHTSDCDNFDNNKNANCVGECDVSEFFILKQYNKNKLFDAL